jgi:Domain of unknown function (DUF4129)
MWTTNSRVSAIATLALGVVVVVVAVAAQAPASRSTPVDARSAGTPTSALFMLLLGVGVVMVAALVVVVWSGRRRKDDPPDHEPTPMRLHWVWKLLAVLLPLALGGALIAAALLGARPAHYVPPPPGGGYGLLPLQHPPLLPGNRRTGFVVPAWLPWTVLGIVGVAITALLVTLWLRRHRPVVGASEPGVARAAVEAAIGALDAETDPRRAVIAAYGAMQRTFADHGIGRCAAEAPREYLGRTLAASRATEREATTLTGLFEEARHSIHPIPERLRELALSTLRSLQGRLRAEGAE